MNLKKFRPRDVVNILLDVKQPTFMKTWALARLLVWMCLDQRPGRRDPKKKGNFPRFRRRNAEYAGHLALASMLDRAVKSRAIKRWDPEVFDMLGLFVKTGSFRIFLNSPRGVKSLLSRLEKASMTLHLVHEIVDYISRATRRAYVPRERTIEYAKKFVNRTAEKKIVGANRGKKPIDSTTRTIAKYWEMSKQARPYMYAFGPIFCNAIRRSDSLDELVEELESIAADQRRLERLVGTAAHAANILHEIGVRNARITDFPNVKVVKPAFRPFTPDEEKIISEIDPNEVSEKDMKDYKPKYVYKRTAGPRPTK